MASRQRSWGFASRHCHCAAVVHKAVPSARRRVVGSSRKGPPSRRTLGFRLAVAGGTDALRGAWGFLCIVAPSSGRPPLRRLRAWLLSRHSAWGRRRAGCCQLRRSRDGRCAQGCRRCHAHGHHGHDATTPSPNLLARAGLPCRRAGKDVIGATPPNCLTTDRRRRRAIKTTYPRPPSRRNAWGRCSRRNTVLLHVRVRMLSSRRAVASSYRRMRARPLPE